MCTTVQVMLLTDGDVSNTREVISLVQKNADNTRYVLDVCDLQWSNLHIVNIYIIQHHAICGTYETVLSSFVVLTHYLLCVYFGNIVFAIRLIPK